MREVPLEFNSFFKFWKNFILIWNKRVFLKKCIFKLFFFCISHFQIFALSTILHCYPSISNFVKHFAPGSNKVSCKTNDIYPPSPPSLWNNLLFVFFPNPRHLSENNSSSSCLKLTFVFSPHPRYFYGNNSYSSPISAIFMKIIPGCARNWRSDLFFPHPRHLYENNCSRSAFSVVRGTGFFFVRHFFICRYVFLPWPFRANYSICGCWI